MYITFRKFDKNQRKTKGNSKKIVSFPWCFLSCTCVVMLINYLIVSLHMAVVVLVVVVVVVVVVASRRFRKGYGTTKMQQRRQFKKSL